MLLLLFAGNLTHHYLPTDTEKANVFYYVTPVNLVHPDNVSNEVKCSAFDKETIFHSHANKTHFHKKGLKLRVFGIRMWPISFRKQSSLLNDR